LSPRTVEDISGLSDHDILVRLYQKLIDHLQEYDKDTGEIKKTLDDHETRLCLLENCETVEHAKLDLMSAIGKHPLTLVLIGVLLSFGSWAGYRLLCHLLGGEL